MNNDNYSNELEKECTDFYTHHAELFSQIAHETSGNRYVSEQEPRLKGDLDLVQRMQQLVPPGTKGLDAGCGPGARDVKLYTTMHYDIYGIDAVEESIGVAKKKYPELKGRLAVHNLAEPLDYPDDSFDFILCNCVIQHMKPELVYTITFKEFYRILKKGGKIQLMFKTGSGLQKIYDAEYERERLFQLYEPEQVITYFKALGFEIIPSTQDAIGGIIYFTDVKPMPHCVCYLQKK